MQFLVSYLCWCDSDWLFFPAIATRIDGFCAFLADLPQEVVLLATLSGAVFLIALLAPVLLGRELPPAFGVFAPNYPCRFFDSRLRHGSPRRIPPAKCP